LTATLSRKKLKVAVLMGGWSAEREISLRTGGQVSKALKSLGYQVTEIDVGENFIEEIKEVKPDVVFIALHGRFGEDGTVQGVLDLLGLPYTGSGVLASALGLNKVKSKQIFKACGIPTPDFLALSEMEYKQRESESEQKIIERIGLPLVVKPACEGSTIGLSIVKEESQLKLALGKAFKYDREVVVEKFIQGKEVTVGILGDESVQALPTLEIVSKKEFYDFEAKYTVGLSEHVIPARIPEHQQLEVQELAIKAHKALGCENFSRVDLIVEPGGEAFVLEVNTIPGLTEISLFPDAARAAGISFPQLISKLIDLALAKSKTRPGNSEKLQTEVAHNIL
jgi:D-alanine-D-alanine ligase